VGRSRGRELTSGANAPATPRYLPAGEAAIVVEFGETVDRDLNARVLAFDAALTRAQIPGVLEAVPTYRSLLVEYDPAIIGYEALVERLAPLGSAPADSVAGGRRWIVPVAYGGEYGDDLDEIARRHGLSATEVIALHLSGDYRIYMIGFAPGFAYLGGLPAGLATSRRKNPRARVPAGSIIIGGAQAAIVSTPIPSGWHILGRTPVRAFDLRRADPFLFRAGDRIRFRRIDRAEFERLADAAARGASVAELEERP
jgi:KipI family sensor histidine kinase inhibitor